MAFRIGILGGGLQGTEAAFLARMAGWETLVVDARPAPPASGLAGKFVRAEVRRPSDLDRAFQGVDLVLPALENPEALRVAEAWRDRWASPPVAFDFAAFGVSRDKRLSKALFRETGVPCPLEHPEAELPLIAKPADMSGSKGVRILETPEELREALESGGDPLVEEHCPGPSYSLEVTGSPGCYRTWQVTRLEMDEVFDCRKVTAPADLGPEAEAELRGHAVSLAGALGLRGIMDIEIIMSPCGMKVLEIDARLPSQTPACVYLSTGENLVAILARIFADGAGGDEGPAPCVPRGAVYEHLALGPGRIRGTGEHRLASAGPLRITEGFMGCDYALLDPAGAAPGGVVTLLASGKDLAEAEGIRDEAVARMARDLGLEAAV
ncbi:MAG: 3-methylornithine--L-lysine ligase PylC [Deltaproteobacteria bacterium]|nr:3-methylornithine--L-lysine ligase PylC [Deltaproteobacteria bacterium]